ncbi:MAG: glycosyltransferase family 39 protein [Anaerolineales bacterium]
MEPGSFFAEKKWQLFLVLALLFAAGLAVRLYDLTDLPLDFHPTRQLHSALMARGMYYQSAPQPIPDWQREMAVKQWKLEAIIEPPFMEWLTAQTYRLIGSADLWVARLYSILFWMTGGIGLFLLARRMAGADGAVFGLAYYLILPFAVIASRSFQPDPLMTTLIVFSFWAALHWQDKPGWRRAVLAGGLSALAILCKAVAAFFVGGAWLGLILLDIGLRNALRNRWLWLISVLAALPYGIYHFYGIYVSGFLVPQLSGRFFPKLWFSPAFYLGWTTKIESTVGLGWVLMAILGSFVICGRSSRALVLGGWLGYTVYSVVLPHHTMTHDYYQLPLVVLVALGISGTFSGIARHLKGPRPLLLVIVHFVLVTGVALKGYQAYSTLKKVDYRGEVAFWQMLGDKVGHDTRVTALTPDYGTRLAYWGWVIPNNWPSLADLKYQGLDQISDFASFLNSQTEGRDYFLITMLDELERQPQLKELLTAWYPVADQGPGYIIFNTRNPLPSAEGY